MYPSEVESILAKYPPLMINSACAEGFLNMKKEANVKIPTAMIFIVGWGKITASSREYFKLSDD